MKECEQLFLHTLCDMENRLISEDPYEVLGLSVLIRKLLLNVYPLVDQVNQPYHQKIKFKISDPDSPSAQLIKSMKPVFYSVKDGLDPDTKITNAKVLEVNSDQFFNTEVLITKGKPYSIRELILFEANIMEDVHLETPRNEKEKALAEINYFYIGGNTRAALRQLKSISHVILKALKSLQVIIEKSV